MLVFNIYLLFAVPIEQTNITIIESDAIANQSVNNNTLCLYGFEYVNGTCKEIF